MKGADIIAASKSGTGKTAAFLLPMLNRVQKISNKEHHVLRGLILVPTRELVDQVSMALTTYGRHLKLKHTKIQGGVSKDLQQEKLATGIDIIVATSGRLKALIEENKIDISSINMVVLDEADTMLDMGFIDEINFILANCSKKRQIMMFSATISQNIRTLGKKYLNTPTVIEVSERRDVVKLIEHRAFKVDVKRKKDLAVHLLKNSRHRQALIFVNTKEIAEPLMNFLKKQGINAVAVHGDIPSKERGEAIKSFRNKKSDVLVATDIAGRGIDIKDLDLVINYELPEKTDDFTHRVGRTGRAGKKGEVYTLLTVTDYNHFAKIERDLKLSIKREIEEGFELKDRQPRQKQMKKKSLREKKGYVKKPKEPKPGAKSKKTTKRDTNRSFGNRKTKEGAK